MTTIRDGKTPPESTTRTSAGETNKAATGRTMRVVSIDLIDPDENNRHINEQDEEFATLVDSVRVLGVLDPIHVRVEGDRFQIVDGERRWRAARKAKLAELPCYVWSASATSRDTLVAGIILNEQRQAHSCIHIARRLREIKMTNGLSGEQVAACTGLSLDHVKTYLCLFNGSEFLLEFFAKHDVSLTIAAELIRYEKATNEARARTLALRHLESPLTREELVRKRKQDTESSSKNSTETSVPPARASTLGRSLERAWRRDPQAARAELEAALRDLGFQLVAVAGRATPAVG